MARIKRAVNAHKKRRKIMKLAKGYWGAKSKQYRAATEQVARSLRYAYIGQLHNLATLLLSIHSSLNTCHFLFPPCQLTAYYL